MKINLKEDGSRITGKKMNRFADGTGQDRRQAFASGLSNSVNPLFQLAHQAEFYSSESLVTGGRS